MREYNEPVSWWGWHGWQSQPMTGAEAERYIADHPAPTPRVVAPAHAEWRFDHRFSEWAWFDGDRRIS